MIDNNTQVLPPRVYCSRLFSPLRTVSNRFLSFIPLPVPLLFLFSYSFRSLFPALLFSLLLKPLSSTRDLFESLLLPALRSLPLIFIRGGIKF